MSGDLREPFQLGRVMMQMVNGIAGNAVLFFGLALAVNILPVWFQVYSLSQLPDPGQTNSFAALTQTFSALNSAFTAMIVAAIANGFLYSALAYGLLEESEGIEADFASCISNGLRFCLPMIALNFIWSISVGFGLVLLIIPGILIMLAWSLTVPVLVGEETGLVNSFSRSSSMTSGVRTEIFICLIIFLLISVALSFVLQGFSISADPAMARSNPLASGLITLLNQTVQPVLLISFLVALYREVELVKEGGGAKGLADVFA